MAKMIVKRQKDARYNQVILNRVADLPGGVGIETSKLGGNAILEGTIVGKPVNGLCEVLKVAKVVEQADGSATTYKVEKGHHFKVGDVVCAKQSSAAYAITGINTSNAAYDVLTVGTTLGAVVKKDAFLYEAAAAKASGSAFKVAPYGVCGTTYFFAPGENVQEDVWVIGVLNPAVALPTEAIALMKGIIL